LSSLALVVILSFFFSDALPRSTFHSPSSLPVATRPRSVFLAR